MWLENIFKWSFKNDLKRFQNSFQIISNITSQNILNGLQSKV
jgi:hypothetical protein